MTVEGVDFSHWNALPRLAKYDFVFIKATQGGIYIDPTYRDRRDTIRKAGKVFGAYHFITTGVRAALQVTHFLNVADVTDDEVLILDFEDDGTWHFHTAKFLADLATEFMTTLARLRPNNRTLLYCNRFEYGRIIRPYSVPVGDGLWIASPSSEPTMPWLFWQYGQSGIDLNRGQFVDSAQLHTWAEGVSSDMSWDEELVLEAPSSRWREPGTPPYTEKHRASEALGNTMYYASDAHKNTQQIIATQATILANQGSDDLDDQAILDRLAITYRETLEASLAQVVGPALRETVREVLSEEQAELAGVFLQKLGEKLAANQAPSQ
jgi:hypothetical protein